MIQILKKETLTAALLVIGVFYFSFMILDRVLSIIYNFNFQPYGPHMPPGFTLWGHIFNGSMAALGLFITFKLYDYGGKKNMWLLQVLAIIIAFTVGAVIPFMNDAQYIESHGMGSIIPVYVIANDLYVFSWGLLVYKIAKSIKKRAILLVAMLIAFLIIHFLIYALMFPEFYWS
jgi:hypothetical protein